MMHTTVRAICSGRISTSARDGGLSNSARFARRSTARRATTSAPTPLTNYRIDAMTALDTQPNLPEPDDFYAELIAMHRGLSDAQSVFVNAKLILLLAN